MTAATTTSGAARQSIAADVRRAGSHLDARPAIGANAALAGQGTVRVSAAGDPIVELRGEGLNYDVHGFETVDQAAIFLRSGDVEPGTPDDPNIWCARTGTTLTWEER